MEQASMNMDVETNTMTENKNNLFQIRAHKISVMSARLSNTAGMSLVEIMIVLGIIGTILGLIGNSIVGANEKAKAKEARMAMAQMMNGISTYESDCGKFPEAIDELIKPSESCQTWEPIKLKLKAGKILDPWGNEFIYSKSESGDVILKSYGKDGKEGGTGVNADISIGDDTGPKNN